LRRVRYVVAVSTLSSEVPVLMYASDYPNGESHFPKSVETVLGWDMTQTRKRMLFWDNAVRFYARSGLS
jgi:predicted TIM-barrel fold metal-dependent hydrolase